MDCLVCVSTVVGSILQTFVAARSAARAYAVYVFAVQNLRTKLESERSAEIRRIDEQKARHLAALTKAHEIAFQVPGLCDAMNLISTVDALISPHWWGGGEAPS